MFYADRDKVFILVYKPIIERIVEGRRAAKGNVDAELVLHAAAIEYDNYDKAVIVTNDGDLRTNNTT